MAVSFFRVVSSGLVFPYQAGLYRFRFCESEGIYIKTGVILTALRDPPPGGGAGGQAGSGK